jgi:hypothetical protein
MTARIVQGAANRSTFRHCSQALQFLRSRDDPSTNDDVPEALGATFPDPVDHRGRLLPARPPGLALALLGIKDSATLNVQIRRGALFDTPVVSELVKQRFNDGKSADL